ncbi:MAG: hypothetical protein ABW321_29315 [Polyangiales bacterium]
MSSSQAPQVFVEDLFIVDQDEHGQQVVYMIAEEDWKAEPGVLESDGASPLVGDVLPLLRCDAVFAEFPADTYFVNLTSLTLNRD